ncbi:MAG: PIN domain-containing protein [Myxococcales bacterium]|nr:PIN domain-containing protein [Myxococcales bacterium]
MAYTVVVDANVLYDAAARDLLIRFAIRGSVRVRWTEHILDECFHALRSNRPDLREDRLIRMRKLMCDAVPDCIIMGYEPLVEAIQVPDTGDRHVVAAAVKSDAQAIVTYNTRDFPNESIGQYHLEVIHPDDFFVNQIDLDPIAAVHVIRELAEDLKVPPRTPAEIVAGLEARGLAVIASRLRALLFEPGGGVK